jgi:hypothetical protein
MRQTSHKLRCGFIPRQRIDAINHIGGSGIRHAVCQFMAVNPTRFTGFTLIELAVTTLISLILVLAVGIVVVGGQRAWQCTYNTANKKIKQDAETVMITFGNVGRKSNQPKCAFSGGESPLYHVSSSNFTPAVPAGLDPVVFGDAVEFRYWDVGLDTTDSHRLMDNAKRATAYALFYIEHNYTKDVNELKVDYGPYPPGAVSSKGVKNTPDRTEVLAGYPSNVTPGTKGAFSYTTSGGVGEGSIRINITITDPVDKESIKVMTATLMRTEWPTTH